MNTIEIPVQWLERLALYADKVDAVLPEIEDPKDFKLHCAVVSLLGYIDSVDSLMKK